MADRYAKLKSSIWDDADFVALDGAAQRLYLLLLSQPDLTSCGLIPLRVRRWAQMAADTTAEHDAVRADLDRLAAARFIVVDWDREELWVRSFIRHDGILGVPKQVIGARRTAGLVTSPMIRAAIDVEYPMLASHSDADSEGLPKPTETPTEGLPDADSEPLRYPIGKGIGNPTREGIREDMPSPLSPKALNCVKSLYDGLQSLPAEAAKIAAAAKTRQQAIKPDPTIRNLPRWAKALPGKILEEHQAALIAALDADPTHTAESLAIGILGVSEFDLAGLAAEVTR